MSNLPPSSAMFPADNPAAIAHVNLLQAIINRLATQSSSSKTWCLTLLGALIAFAGATKQPAVISFTLLPILVFGFVDTMYLAQEKAYRDHYNSVAAKLRDGSYKLTDAFGAAVEMSRDHVIDALKSWSIWPVYGVLLITYVLAHKLDWLNMLKLG